MTRQEKERARSVVQCHLGQPEFALTEPAQFRRLVERVRDVVATPIAPDVLAGATALCALRKGIEWPPDPLVQEFVKVLRRLVPDPAQRETRAVEVGIPFGCGVWRTVLSQSTSWHGRWRGAFEKLEAIILRTILNANRWLSRCIKKFPPEGDPLFHGLAAQLAWQLVRPEDDLELSDRGVVRVVTSPDGAAVCALARRDAPTPAWETAAPSGAKLVLTLHAGTRPMTLTARGQAIPVDDGARVVLVVQEQRTTLRTDSKGAPKELRLKPWETVELDGVAIVSRWECSCGRKDCADCHRLESWRPYQVVTNRRGQPKPLMLADFVASALKGPQRHIKVNSFVSGMYCALLAWGV